MTATAPHRRTLSLMHSHKKQTAHSHSAPYWGQSKIHRKHPSKKLNNDRHHKHLDELKKKEKEEVSMALPQSSKPSRARHEMQTLILQKVCCHFIQLHPAFLNLPESNSLFKKKNLSCHQCCIALVIFVYFICR